MTPTKWITQMNAIGIVSKAGRYGGTYAHSCITATIIADQVGIHRKSVSEMLYIFFYGFQTDSEKSEFTG